MDDNRTKAQEIAESLDFLFINFGHEAVMDWLTEFDGWAPLIRDLAIPVIGTYERHRVGVTDGLELYFIVWGFNANSGFHGHPEGGCWMRVLQGSLFETFLDGTVKVHGPGSSGFQQGAAGIHRIETRGPAVSVHIYAPRALNSAVSVKNESVSK
jgi:hypothetical protein